MSFWHEKLYSIAFVLVLYFECLGILTDVCLGHARWEKVVLPNHTVHLNAGEDGREHISLISGPSNMQITQLYKPAIPGPVPRSWPVICADYNSELVFLFIYYGHI